jgi:hypothetical protein
MIVDWTLKQIFLATLWLSLTLKKFLDLLVQAWKSHVHISMQKLSKNYWGYTSKSLVHHMSLTMNLVYGLWEATLHKRRVKQSFGQKQLFQ